MCFVVRGAGHSAESRARAEVLLWGEALGYPRPDEFVPPEALAAWVEGWVEEVVPWLECHPFPLPYGLNTRGIDNTCYNTYTIWHILPYGTYLCPSDKC